MRTGPLPSNEIMKYEYLTRDMGNEVAGRRLDSILNDYANQGWELFHVSNILGWENTYTGNDERYLIQQFIFRRPKSEK